MYRVIKNGGMIDKVDNEIYEYFTSIIYEIYAETAKDKEYYCIEVDGN